MKNQKRKALTIKDKYNIIQQLEMGIKQSVICREMSLPKSTVQTLYVLKVGLNVLRRELYN